MSANGGQKLSERHSVSDSTSSCGGNEDAGLPVRDIDDSTENNASRYHLGMLTGASVRQSRAGQPEGRLAKPTKTLLTTLSTADLRLSAVAGDGDVG